MKNLKDKLDQLVKNSDLIVSSPETMERLKKEGLPIKSTFITYEEYLDKLFEARREIATDLIKELPLLDEGIANATVQALYEEIKEAFVLGIPGAGITLSLILLELGLKYRLFSKRLEDDPNSNWDYIEQLNLRSTIKELKSKDLISEQEKQDLEDFNNKVRNPYIHYNIKYLIKDMEISELPELNVETGELKIHRNVKPANINSLWFSAKKVLDKKTVKYHVDFCISWVNKLLGGKNNN